ESPLFADLPPTTAVWMSHGDKIDAMPPGFKSLAYTENSQVAVMGNDKGIYGLQFHPEVVHTPDGKTILKNFITKVCGCKGNWTIGNFITESINNIKAQVGKGKVISALSGGVDSAVAATLIHRAIGDQLTCIFVNNGLLRREEVERTFNTFRLNLGMNIQFVDATDRFLDKVKGVIDPEQKRKTIGEEFIHVFEEEATKIGKVDFLAQGTLYPDVIESAVSASNVAAKIKTHHNVGGLPAKMMLKLIEPLRYLFKDEVRRVGEALGLPKELVWRQPFPGPGLAVRCLGEITPERVEKLRLADAIFTAELANANLLNLNEDSGEGTSQAFAVLLPVKSVGVMGDQRTYQEAIALRAVVTEDFMTASWAKLPYAILAKVSSRIVNEVRGINRVVYDITTKPPATIEWE
ncbi:glutamine-hydrolyzing GMP synthase, partial [bacterium]